tara:strand:- start:25 stop:1290 length:1266 start_codon:yes stop_codon:yes gene_type:complete
MSVFELFMDPIVYIRFITQFSPILFSFLAIIDSAYNMTLKGILYVFGVTLTMSIGKLLSASFPFRVPGVEDGMKESEFGLSKLKSDKYGFNNPKYHPSCNLISKPDHAGWGTFYSSPDMYGLFYSFTLVYIVTSMLNNNDFNIFILSILLFFFLLSSYFRTQVFYCVQFRDILIGTVIGSLIGFLWFMFVSITEKSLKIYDLTYFNNNKENNNKCKMKNKQFRCKKIKLDVEKDNQIRDITLKANMNATLAAEASNKLDTEKNFTLIWKLYETIITKARNKNYNEKVNTTYKLNITDTETRSVYDFFNLNSQIINSSKNNGRIIQNIYNVDKEDLLTLPINTEICKKDGVINNKTKFVIDNSYLVITDGSCIKVKDVLNTNYFLFYNFFNSISNSNYSTNSVLSSIKNDIGSKSKLPIKIL